MKKIKNFIIGDILIGSTVLLTPLIAEAQESLSIVYPPENHQTISEQIFLIGTSSVEGEVLINNKKIKRSPGGHFAPSFPLQLGENIFTIRQSDREITVKVTRVSNFPSIPTSLGFAENSLTPNVDIMKEKGESICFSAIAFPDSEVSVRLKNYTIPLLPEIESIALPPNSGVLVNKNNPQLIPTEGQYRGCYTFEEAENLGKPLFQISLNGKTVEQIGNGEINISDKQNSEIVEVISDRGTARTGASTNYSRLTPLPKGTRAKVTGKEGEWLRLDYGGWIKAEETKIVPNNLKTTSLIRSINSQQRLTETDIIFPLEVPVPVKVFQNEDKFILTLYNTIAQTDTIRLDNNPFIKSLNWEQVNPTEVVYTFNLKTTQQWGYDLKYQGTELILSLRHPPQLLNKKTRPLQGIKILLDPGHGGKELGAKSPTGYPEKDMNLVISKLISKELKKLGATVYLTRETDIYLSLKDRIKAIDNLKPHLALSIHYNALPDDGDAENTQGISTFWYHPQAHDLAIYFHDRLVKNLDRPSYGVFWNNLALTRPHTAPSVLLEFGFAINPTEFEWIIDSKEQKKLASEVALILQEWFRDR